MSSKKKALKINDDDSMEQPSNATSINLNNETADPAEEVPKDNLKIVFIPKSLHEHFECVVGKHVFVDKPWTKISHKKIIENLQSQKSNSCFWQFRKKLEDIKSENVLVGYKPFSDTDEEFLICITDKAKRYMEEKQTQMEREHKQKVERSLQCRVPGPWESKSSEKDIEEIKSVQTRENITYEWKLPAKRLQAKAQFEDSDSKSMKNKYVKLEPRSKEIFESSDMFMTDSSVQAVRKMVDREMQTIPRFQDNKCIQSMVDEEKIELFQLKPLTKSDQALDDFLEKHVPNLVNQLPYNELCDLYYDDYKLLKNKNEVPINQTPKVIKPLPGYQNIVSQKRYVSSHTWHPTIPGIFAVSYMTNSNALYKSVSLETPAEEMARSTDKDEKYGISYTTDNDNNQEFLENQPEIKLVDENYKEKIISMLNKEFIQRMKIIQMTEEEKNNELQCGQDQNMQDIMISQLRSSIVYTNQPSTNLVSSRIISGNGIFIDQNVITIDEAQNENKQTDIDTLKNIEEGNELNCLENEFSVEKNQHKTQIKEIKEVIDHTKFITTTADAIENENEDRIDHHDSDTESFYNIWGDDEEWLYGNKIRNIVRNKHREFNRKYDREAREEKLFKLLKSEAKYTDMKNKVDNMEKEIMKLTKNMFEAGDMYTRLQLESKSKNKRKSLSKQNKQHRKSIQIYEESKREHPPIMDEENNSVIVWSINDNIFPKLILESPEEVRCVEFNPRDGNTVVGGLTNGQICIWDINGKLETIDLSDDLSMSERQKMHHQHLWAQMKWSLDINFKTRIRPAAFSAILKSHESTVTAIQWIHPMNEITPLGKLVTVQEGQFSCQFFSASMDGTVKLWDLKSTPLPKIKQKNTTSREHLENLKKYKSPLNIYNNRLQPSYTIVINEPENTMHSPITAFSFEIPLIQYNCTSNQPLVIGKRQFEFVPAIPNDSNRILVVGSIMGQIGVVTWNGYDTHQQSRQNEEVCKHIWWGHTHDGPINCIKRNVFYPDIHLVCGGHIVSIWSLNYKNGPIWWKRFDDLTNSVLWSTIHPAEFQVSFNTSGVLQFWNFMKYTHQPYYKSDIFLGDGLLASLSAPLPSIHYVGAEQLKFASGIHQVIDQNKNELISFSDSAGTIIMITVEAMSVKSTDIEEVGHVFQREVDWRRELDVWNEKYKERFGSLDEKNIDDNKSTKKLQIPASVSTQDGRTTVTLTQMKRKIYDETFKWYFNNVKARLDKMDVEYMEREKLHMIEALMKKKNVDEKVLREYLKEMEGKKCDEDDMTKIQVEDDETLTDIVNKLLTDENPAKEYTFRVDSKRSTYSDHVKNAFEKIHRLLVTDIVTEKEKLKDFIRNNPYEVKEEDWTQVIEFAEREVRDRLNDPTLLKNPALRMMRRKLAKKYIDEGYKIKEWKSRKEVHSCDLYEIRECNIDKLKAVYGQSYDPYWDKDLRPQTMSEAARTRKAESGDKDYERPYGGYFVEKRGKNDHCYAKYLSLVESASSYPCDMSEEISERREEATVESEDLYKKPCDTAESFKRELVSRRNRQAYEYDEYRSLETPDEQDRAE